ncbi:hypothetical protein EYF80_043534 [Liparis tanakae]|uniref:Uncharacterized protein n=1 Tax=Liparis tanakae TaxID=230148 RepID=A0A4Z2G0B3_9TELE|nr:hypothetical protein EYF80_043534 [Liparis tanakae]
MCKIAEDYDKPQTKKRLPKPPKASQSNNYNLWPPCAQKQLTSAASPDSLLRYGSFSSGNR